MNATLNNLNTLAFIGGIGAMEITVLAILGVLIFGKRLPDVGKNIGRSIIEFKKGLSGITDELDIKQIKEDVSVNPLPSATQNSQTYNQTAQSNIKSTSQTEELENS